MQRTLNYTGRKRIEQSEVVFTVSESDGAPSFNAEFRFDNEGIPSDARVYIDAYFKETRQRFAFGTVSRIIPPVDTKLTEIDLSGSPLFRVLIVDESASHGKLLASGDKFRANAGDLDDENRSSLFAVKSRPLGQSVWKVDVQDSERPELLLNSSIPNAIGRIKSDPVFQSMILPSALKEVLIYLFWNEDDEDSDSFVKWKAFAESFADALPEERDPQIIISWIDDVVSSFSARFDMCDRLLGALKED